MNSFVVINDKSDVEQEKGAEEPREKRKRSIFLLEDNNEEADSDQDPSKAAKKNKLTSEQAKNVKDGRILQELNSLTEDEIELYDRQIRLWGLEAQKRLNNGKVLLINLNNIGNEVAKNLTLAGIKRLTIIDSSVITEKNVHSQFLITRSEVGRKRLEAAIPRLVNMNERVQIDRILREAKELNCQDIEDYDVVVCLSKDFRLITELNDICRRSSKPFYASFSFGLYAFVFADLLDYEYSIEVKTPGSDEKKTIRRSCSFTSFGEAIKCKVGKQIPPRQMKSISSLLPLFISLAKFQIKHGTIPDDNEVDIERLLKLMNDTCESLEIPTNLANMEIVKKFMYQKDLEVAAIGSIVGSILSQGILNTLSLRENPIVNFLIYEGDTFLGPIYNLQPN